MLCLTAKEGSYLMIGDDIKVIFLKPKASGQMHIGISAPKSVSIRRDKVFEQELKEFMNDESKSPAEIFKAMELRETNKKERAQAVSGMHKRAAKKSREEAKRLEKEAAECRVIEEPATEE